MSISITLAYLNSYNIQGHGLVWALHLLYFYLTSNGVSMFPNQRQK